MRIVLVVSVEIDMENFPKILDYGIHEDLRKDVKAQVSEITYARKVEVVYLPKEIAN